MLAIIFKIYTCDIVLYSCYDNNFDIHFLKTCLTYTIWDTHNIRDGMKYTAAATTLYIFKKCSKIANILDNTNAEVAKTQYREMSIYNVLTYIFSFLK